LWLVGAVEEVGAAAVEPADLEPVPILVQQQELHIQLL